MREVGETELPDLSLTLFADNFNGVFDDGDRQVGETFVTDGNGNIFIPALPNGDYWLLLDESDPDFPVGFSVGNIVNPAPFTVSAGSVLSFGLVNGVVNDDGLADGDATGSGGVIEELSLIHI